MAPGVLKVLVLRMLLVLVVLTSRADAQMAPASDGVITGQIVDGATGRPVSAVVVSIAGSGRTENGGFGLSIQMPRILTSGDGRFIFSGLPVPGTFTITATKNGYAEGASGRRRPLGTTQPVQLMPAASSANMVVRVWKNGAIGGSVIDELGEPVVGVEVRLARQQAIGATRQFMPIAAVQTLTDDRGIYRFSGLPPGDYIVMASPPLVSVKSTLLDDIARTGRGTGELGLTLSSSYYLEVDGAWIALRPGSPVPTQLPGARPRIYPTTFHPSATSPALSSVVTIAAGEERTSIDIQLTPVPTARVSGLVLDPSSAPAYPLTMRLAPKGSADLIGDTLALMSSTDAGGAFVFAAVPAGDYTLRATRGSAPMGELLWAEVPITVGGENVDGVTALLSPGLRVTMRMQFDGNAPPPAAQPGRFTANVFSLEPVERQGGANVSGSISDAGLTLSGYTPGRYRVRVVNSPEGWMFKSAMLNGLDVSETPFELTRDVPDLVLTFTDRWSGIDGAVRGPNADAASVLVFTTDSQAWTTAGPNSRRFHSARAGAGGQFGISSLPPGDYYVAAVADEDADDWRDPATLDTLARTATHITILEGEHKTLDLRVQEVRR